MSYREIEPQSLPVPTEGQPNIPEIIAHLQRESDRAAMLDQELPRILGLDLTPRDRFRMAISRLVPTFFGQEVAPDPIDQMEHIVRGRLNNLLEDLSSLNDVGQLRIERYNQLSDMVRLAKEGKIKPSEIADMMRETAAQRADLPRLPFIEESMEKILADLPPEVQEKRDEQTLARMEMILDLTKPLVGMIEQAFVAGTFAVDQLSQNYFLVTELGPGVKAIKKSARDLHQSAVANLQAPELLKAQVHQAAEGLRFAIDAVLMSEKLQSGGDERLLETLNTQAETIRQRILALPIPDRPQLPDAQHS